MACMAFIITSQACTAVGVSFVMEVTQCSGKAPNQTFHYTIKSIILTSIYLTSMEMADTIQPRRTWRCQRKSEFKRQTTQGKGIERDRHVSQRSKTDRRDRCNGAAGRRRCACPASRRAFQGACFDAQSKRA